jgi:two-component system CheB/CheR fusion protein
MGSSAGGIDGLMTELQALVVTLEDERQRSEAEREKLQTILTNMSDAVLVVNRDGSKLLSNAAYDELFRDGVAMVDPDGDPIASDATPQALAARGEPFTVAFRLIEPSGSVRWFEAKGQRIKVDGTRAAIVQFRDISERSLRLLHEEFVALASHELRTPLTALHAYLQLLSRRPEIREHPQLATYVDTALGESKRLAGLITELTEATRLQAGKLELDRQRVDLGRLVERVVDMSQPLTETQAIRLERTGEVTVSGDADRLQQVILNLIGNAITHAPRSRFINVELRSSGRYAELRVSDEGPGVPKAELPHLFSRFYQVSRKQGGTERGLGLGLYISREIVRAHSGEINVVSVEGKGTTFTVRLPLADKRPVEDPTKSLPDRAHIEKSAAGSRDGRSPAIRVRSSKTMVRRAADGRKRSSSIASPKTARSSKRPTSARGKGR